MRIYNKTQMYLLTCLITVLGVFQAVAQNKDYTVNGTLNNFSPVPEKIFIIHNMLSSGNESTLDSVLVKDGKYSFKGSTDVSVVIHIATSKTAAQEKIFPLMVGNGEIDVVSDGLLSNSKVSGTGSAAHLELAEATSFAKKESLEINRLAATEEYKTNDSLKQVLKDRSTNLFGNALVNMISYVRQHPNSEIAPYMTYTLILSGFVTPSMTDTLISVLPAKVKSGSVGKAIDGVLAGRHEQQIKAEEKMKELEGRIPLGSQAKIFTMNNVAGKPIRLDTFKGKYLLIDFWASWCKPCRAENPNLVKAYAKYKTKGFDILGVSIDGASQKAAWITAIKDDAMSWTQVSDLKGAKNEAAVLYGVESIPQNFLVDPKGKIIAKNLRGAALEEKLAEIFK